MNLTRVGGAAAVGAIGALAGYNIGTFRSPISGHTLWWNLPVGVLALVVGAILQAASPLTAPDVVDGVVDGGMTLAGEWVAYEALWLTGAVPQSIPSPLPMAQARGALGGYGGAPQKELV
jgi:hypothetical protein